MATWADNARMRKEVDSWADEPVGRSGKTRLRGVGDREPAVRDARDAAGTADAVHETGAVHLPTDIVPKR